MKEADLRPKYKLNLKGQYYVENESTKFQRFSPVELVEGSLVLDSTELAARRALIRQNNERTKSKTTSAFGGAWERDALAMSIQGRKRRR